MAYPRTPEKFPPFFFSSAIPGSVCSGKGILPVDLLLLAISFQKGGGGAGDREEGMPPPPPGSIAYSEGSRLFFYLVVSSAHAC